MAMSRTLRFEMEYPHPPDKVWRAIASSDALAEWLMPNDFQPVVGHRFNFRADPAPGFDGVVHCEVLAVEQPHRLSYTWRGGPIDTVVTYELEPTVNGTLLRFEQRGFQGLKSVLVSLMLGGGFKKMWRKKLPRVLARLDEHGVLQPDAVPDANVGCDHPRLARMFGWVTKLVPGSKTNA